MGQCVYDTWSGPCSLWDKKYNKGETFENSEVGWDEEGYCVCQDDPDPSYTCSQYESCYREEY